MQCWAVVEMPLGVAGELFSGRSLSTMSAPTLQHVPQELADGEGKR